MAEPHRADDATTCARPAPERPSATRPLVPPLSRSSVYPLDDLAQVDAIYAGEVSGFIYARDAHPERIPACRQGG